MILVRLSLMLVATLACGSFAHAQETGKPAGLSQCREAIGAYITRRVNEGVSGVENVGRSLLSLTADGLVFFTDSAQGGVEGYQPFSNGQGTWRCEEATGGMVRFGLLFLDFTFPTSRYPDPLIARADIEATLTVANGSLAGVARLSFVPLGGDPLDQTTARSSLSYEFTGKRIGSED